MVDSANYYKKQRHSQKQRSTKKTCCWETLKKGSAKESENRYFNLLTLLVNTTNFARTTV